MRVATVADYPDRVCLANWPQYCFTRPFLPPALQTQRLKWRPRYEASYPNPPHSLLSLILKSSLTSLSNLPMRTIQTCKQPSRGPAVRGWRHPPWRCVLVPAGRTAASQRTAAAQRWQSLDYHWLQHHYTFHRAGWSSKTLWIDSEPDWGQGKMNLWVTGKL